MSIDTDIEDGAAAARRLIDRRNNVDPDRPSDPQARRRYDTLQAERQLDPTGAQLRAEIEQQFAEWERDKPDYSLAPDDPTSQAAVAHTMQRCRAEGLIP